MINILLNGACGKMGTMIASTTKSFDNLNIAAGVDRFKGGSAFPIYDNIFECSEQIDVILDFSRPDSLDSILAFAKEKALPVVLCTTGYSSEQLVKIEKASTEIPIFRSANMSLGINVINTVLKKISPFLYNNFDIEIIEKHHNQKVDAPSGTALLLANTIKDSISEETNFVYGREGTGRRNKSDIGLHAIRGGSIVGDHDVIFAGQGEIIEISHSAQSREVFAVGALKACEFMYKKEAGQVYSMDDLIKLSLKFD